MSPIYKLKTDIPEERKKENKQTNQQFNYEPFKQLLGGVKIFHIASTPTCSSERRGEERWWCSDAEASAEIRRCGACGDKRMSCAGDGERRVVRGWGRFAVTLRSLCDHFAVTLFGLPWMALACFASDGCRLPSDIGSGPPVSLSRPVSALVRRSALPCGSPLCTSGDDPRAAMRRAWPGMRNAKGAPHLCSSSSLPCFPAKVVRFTLPCLGMEIAQQSLQTQTIVPNNHKDPVLLTLCCFVFFS